MALQQILPQFLQLLAQDFESWSSGARGQATRGGGLLSGAAGSNGSSGADGDDEAAIEIDPAAGAPEG